MFCFLQEQRDSGLCSIIHLISIKQILTVSWLWEATKFMTSMWLLFKRQDPLWYASGSEKLPVILKATKMLICAEDLGLCRIVYPRLWIARLTALKVQRMPSDNIPFYDPNMLVIKRCNSIFTWQFYIKTMVVWRSGINSEVLQQCKQ
jgi:4-alpha-glucanotransferase